MHGRDAEPGSCSAEISTIPLARRRCQRIWQARVAWPCSAPGRVQSRALRPWSRLGRTPGEPPQRAPGVRRLPHRVSKPRHRPVQQRRPLSIIHARRGHIFVEGLVQRMPRAVVHVSAKIWSRSHPASRSAADGPRSLTASGSSRRRWSRRGGAFRTWPSGAPLSFAAMEDVAWPRTALPPSRVVTGAAGSWER